MFSWLHVTVLLRERALFPGLVYVDVLPCKAGVYLYFRELAGGFAARVDQDHRGIRGSVTKRRRNVPFENGGGVKIYDALVTPVMLSWRACMPPAAPVKCGELCFVKPVRFKFFFFPITCISSAREAPCH